jgi:large subunit ribosomal protein L25
MDEKIEISIPVHLTGEAKGVKEGGILEQSLWELEIKCLPTEILDSIDVDISDLGINETIYVKDIPLKEGIELLTDEELPVATIRAMIEVPEEEVVEEEIAAPEVITEKKREEEEEEEE